MFRHEPLGEMMTLEKYYIDVVAKDGSGAYLQSARAQVMGLPVSACTSHPFDKNGPLLSATELHQWEVDVRPDVIHAASIPLVTGALTLRPISAAAPIELFRSERGVVTWEVLACDATVHAHLNGESMNGRGYAELLSMTIAPWELPIARHWWGRTIIDDHSFVWLVWEGDESRTIGLVNGRLVQHVEVREDRVVLDQYELVHTSPVALRTGSVMESTLGPLRPLASWLPHGTWDLDEHRWLCETRVMDISKRTELGTGWTLHERIDWKGRS